MRRMIALSAALLAAACSTFQIAEMRLPSSLGAGTERIEIAGMNGWTHGRFTAGEYHGGYERGLDRLEVANLFRRTGGHAEFTLFGPGISDDIEGRCQVRERALTLEGVEFKPAPMAYRCDFYAQGRDIPARFELQESHRGLADVLTRDARRGEIGLAGEIVRFRSVHKVRGVALPVENPIGYVFERDGRAIGALQLNGGPVLILPHDTEVGPRRAMMVASLALATIWDPSAVLD